MNLPSAKLKLHRVQWKLDGKQASIRKDHKGPFIIEVSKTILVTLGG